MLFEINVMINYGNQNVFGAPENLVFGYNLLRFLISATCSLEYDGKELVFINFNKLKCWKCQILKGFNAVVKFLRILVIVMPLLLLCSEW